MKQITLSDAISDNQTLTTTQVNGILEILGNRCKASTKEELKIVLSGSLSERSNFASFKKILLNDPHSKDGVSFTAGQDYRVEVAKVRKQLLAS
jgi:hypothetical protein